MILRELPDRVSWLACLVLKREQGFEASTWRSGRPRSFAVRGDCGSRCHSRARMSLARFGFLRVCGSAGKNRKQAPRQVRGTGAIHAHDGFPRMFQMDCCFCPLPAAKRSAEPHILCRNRGLDFVPFGFPKSTKPKRVPFHKRAKHHKLPVRLVSVEPIERPFRSLHRGRSEPLVHGVFLGSGISNQGLEESKIRFISFDYS